jgi:hypothetical protein
MFRHVGLVFLVPAVTPLGLPAAFAWPAAYGDLLTGVLALATAAALRRRWAHALAAAWLVNGLGAADLIVALAQGARLGIADHLGAAWYIPTFAVPGALVVHALSFALLLRQPRSAGAR